MIVAREAADYGLEAHRRGVPVQVRSGAGKKARFSLMGMVVFAFVLAAAFSYANTYTMNVSYQAQKIEKNIGMLEAENTSLRMAIDRLDSLPRVEMLAVTQLGMVRPTPNDVLFVAVGDSGPAGATAPGPAYAVTGSNLEERGLPGGKPSDPGMLHAFLNLVVR